jgi:hypothetical protein
MANHDNAPTETDPTGWYRETPLDRERSIRLIKLNLLSHDANSTDVISCKVTRLCFSDWSEDHFNMSQLDYIALSYTWGDPKRNSDQNGTHTESRLPSHPKTIYHNEIGLPITANLFSLLATLRQRRYDCWLWADAICVNQHNMIEWSAQVQLMANIYAKASAVLIWLGEADEYTSDAFCAMHAISEAAKQISTVPDIENDTLENPISEPAIRYTRWLPRSTGSFLEPVKPLAALLQRSWFSRVWTLQEAVLAHYPIVMWWELSLNLQPFLDALSFKLLMSADWTEPFSIPLTNDREQSVDTYPSSMAALATGLYETAVLRKILASSDPSWKSSTEALFEMLCSCRGRNATDVRDTIFAYLPICTKFKHPDESDLLIPDYHKPVPIVFIQITHHIVKSLQQLDILTLCCPTRFKVKGMDSEQGRLEDLPSWTPSYNISWTRPLLPRIYRAMGDTKHLCKNPPYMRTIPVF